MGEMEILTEKLQESIQKSECYQNYIHSQQKLSSDPVLKERVYRFKQWQFDIQSRKARAVMPDQEEEKRLGEEYFSLLMNQTASCFLENEKALLNLISSLYEDIVKKLHIDLSYLKF